MTAEDKWNEAILLATCYGTPETRRRFLEQAAVNIKKEEKESKVDSTFLLKKDSTNCS